MQDFDMVIPNKNEQEFIDVALRLKWKRIVFMSEDMNYRCSKQDKIDVKIAFLVKDLNKISHARKRFDYLVADADRKFFESKVDFIMNAEQSERNDSFHYRATQLNQVHAALAKKNNIAITYNFSLLLNSTLRKKQLILGRMMQNAVLVRKFKLNSAPFSFATHPIDMKSRSVLDALVNVLR
jgi:hypothetical protein